MRRFPFYLTIALLAFAIGLFAFKLLHSSEPSNFEPLTEARIEQLRREQEAKEVSEKRRFYHPPAQCEAHSRGH